MKMTVAKALCLLLIIATPSAYGQQAASLPDRIPYRKGNKWGYCNRDKKIIIPVVYDDAGFFGMAPGELDVVVPDSVAWVKKGNKEYWLSKTGKLRPVGSVVFPEPVEEIHDVAMSMELPGIVNDVFTDPKTGKKGVVLYENKKDTLLPARFEELEIDRIRQSRYAMARENGKWGIIITREQKWVVPPAYDKIERIYSVERNGISCDTYKLEDKNLFGLVINDSLVLPVRYTELYLGRSRNSNAVLYAKGKTGVDLFNLFGKKLTSTSYEEISLGGFSMADLAPAKKNGKWGLLSIDGKQMTACKYDGCNLFIEDLGLVWVQYKGKSGLIDAKGTEYFED